MPDPKLLHIPRPHLERANDLSARFDGLSVDRLNALDEEHNFDSVPPLSGLGQSRLLGCPIGAGVGA